MTISHQSEARDALFSDLWRGWKLIKLIYVNFFTNFVKYFIEILGIKLFQDDFGRTVVKLPVKY